MPPRLTERPRQQPSPASDAAAVKVERSRNAPARGAGGALLEISWWLGHGESHSLFLVGLGVNLESDEQLDANGNLLKPADFEAFPRHLVVDGDEPVARAR